jgi:hypothetical protein
MTEDETGRNAPRPLDDPWWSLDDDALSAQRTERQRDQARGPRGRRSRGSGERRSRLVAVVVLVLAALTIAMTGLAAEGSVFGSSGTEQTVPLSVLPFTTSTSTSTTTTSTTAPVAAVVSR